MNTICGRCMKFNYLPRPADTPEAWCSCEQASSCATGHDYQPRHDEVPRFVGPAGYNQSMYVACKEWIGDRCTRCGDWKARP